MGCISVSSTRIGVGLTLSAESLREDIGLSSTRIGVGLMLSAESLREDIGLSINVLNNSLKVSTGVICSINDTFVLDVSPDTVWLTPSNNFSGDFMIVSNVNWLID